MHFFAPKKSKRSNPMCRLVELQSLTFPLVKMDVFLKSSEVEWVHSLILDHGAIVEKEPIYSRWIHPSLTPASSEVFGSQASFCVTLLTRSCWMPSITSPGSTLRTPTANLILNSSLCKPFAGFPRWLFATVFVSNPVWWTNCFSTAQAFIVLPAKEAGKICQGGWQDSRADMKAILSANGQPCWTSRTKRGSHLWKTLFLLWTVFLISKWH